MEQMPVLRRNVKADDLPALYKRAFERELDRVIIAQFQEPGRVADHLAFNRHYARYFTLLATEPRLLDASLESFQEHLARGLSEDDADALGAIASRHQHQPPISVGQLAQDLRDQGVEPSERNLAAYARIAAAAYRNANVEACGALGLPLAENEIWPLPQHLERLAHAGMAPKPPAYQERGTDVARRPDELGEQASATLRAPLLSAYAEQAVDKKIRDGAWDEDRRRDIDGAVRIFVAANGDVPVSAITQQHLIAMKDLFSRLPVVYGLTG